MNISDLMHQAAGLYQDGKWIQADAICQQILQHVDLGDAWHLRGRIAYDQQRFPEAILALQRAVRLLPNLPTIYRYLGLSQRKMGNFQEAESSFRRALVVKPDYYEVLVSLGNLLKEMNRLDESESILRECTQRRPQAAEAHTNLGTLLRKKGEIDEAIACHREALRLDPNHADIHNNLGSTLAELGRFQEATACYDRAIELQPDFGDARLNRASRWLVQGDLERGWPEYEWRWRASELTPRPFQEPLWRGENPTGKTLLLHTEQGLGDAIQFVRYLPMVKSLGAKVILECHPPLVQLFRQLPMDVLVARGDTLPPFDWHAPLLSLPLIFRTTLQTIPRSVPYLRAAEDLLLQWRPRMEGLPGLRIGIAWKGNPLNSHDRDRSFTLSRFERIAALPNITLISLQKDASEEMRSHAERVPLIDLTEEIDKKSGPFMDSAAILSCLDLVITADTSIAHLSGALGVPTWIALPFVADWRWLLDRQDSPWYPTVRLFRQPQRGDWDAVFHQIEQMLAGRLNELPPAPA